MPASRMTSADFQQLTKWAAVLLFSIGAFQLTTWLAPYSPPEPLVAYLVGFGCVVAASIAVALWVPSERWALVIGSCVAALLMIAALLAPGAAVTGYPPLCVLTGLLMLGTGIGAGLGRRGHVERDATWRDQQSNRGSTPGAGAARVAVAAARHGRGRAFSRRVR